MKGLWFVSKGAWWAPLPGFVALVFVLIGWWGDVLKESRGGDHKEVVQISLRYGMVLFIASEVMFFVAWFWRFFEMAIFHRLRAQRGARRPRQPGPREPQGLGRMAGDADVTKRRRRIRVRPSVRSTRSTCR